MKETTKKIMKKAFFTILSISILCSVTLADRALEQNEVLNILAELTEMPRYRWITVGTIEAIHEEYRAPQTTDANEIQINIDEALQEYEEHPTIELTEALHAMTMEAIPFNVRYELSNEYTMTSTVTIRVNGEQFYWQIDVNSRSDSIEKPAELTDNFLTEEFDLFCNETRVFAWDGQKYITYFRPINQAIITDTPSGVNGPLTAGVIPWGYGNYTFETLSQAKLNGIEIETNGQMLIQITITRESGAQESLTLNPAEGYVIEEYTAQLPNGQFIFQIYDNYQQIAGQWCPGSVLIEKYDINQSPHRLLSQDIWDFTMVSEQTPSATDFEANYDMDAYIEDYSFGDEPLIYYYSSPLPPSAKINIDELIQQRLMIESSPYRQNCATASLEYIFNNLGVDCSLETLSSIVSDIDGSTTFAQIRNFAEDMGLNVYAASINMETLRSLSDYQVIVYLPASNHFAVVGEIDNAYIRMVDLSSNHLYSRYSVERFNTIWDGTALLISPDSVRLAFNGLDSSQLNRIVGAGDCEDCKSPCQSSRVLPCQEVMGLCGSAYTKYYARTCCAYAPGHSCSERSLIKKMWQQCGLDEELLCNGYGEWTSSKMSACQ